MYAQPRNRPFLNRWPAKNTDELSNTWTKILSLRVEPCRIFRYGVLFQILLFKPLFKLRFRARKSCSGRYVVAGVQQRNHKNGRQACKDFLRTGHVDYWECEAYRQCVSIGKIRQICYFFVKPSPTLRDLAGIKLFRSNFKKENASNTETHF